jgi:predicted nucleic acid-binding protein
VPTLVDSNVLLDVLTSRSASCGSRRSTPLPLPTLHRLALPWEAAFLAGKCFLAYRKRGGVRGSPLPDFYIGAHASVSGMKLLTRDARRYRPYFPKLRLIAP